MNTYARVGYARVRNVGPFYASSRMVRKGALGTIIDHHDHMDTRVIRWLSITSDWWEGLVGHAWIRALERQLRDGVGA